MSHTLGGVTPRSEQSIFFRAEHHVSLKMQGKTLFFSLDRALPAHLLLLDVAHTPCEICMQGLGINRPVDSGPVTFVPTYKKHFAMITCA